MAGLIWTLVLLWFALGILLYAGTLRLQGIWYNEPPGDLYWRAPAAATVLVAFVAFFCLLEYGHPGDFDPLFFTAQETRQYDELLAVPQGREPIRYRLDKLSGTY